MLGTLNSLAGYKTIENCYYHPLLNNLDLFRIKINIRHNNKSYSKIKEDTFKHRVKF